jgi:hypothetical protein
MTRLTHSFNGFLRSMQMSQNSLFVFIEGGTDRYFYDSILKGTCQPVNVKYEIITSSEIRSEDGGKRTLIAFFDYLKGEKQLINSFHNKISVGFFILDKDIDDIKKMKKRSKHILYTQHYCLENYFYIHGDLVQSSAISASYPIELFEPLLSDSYSWRIQAASHWKEWVKLCIFSSLFCSRGSACNYGVKQSRINSCSYAPIDQSHYESCKKHLLQLSNMQENQFNLEYQKLSDKVDDIFQKGKFDSIFSGKWYKFFLGESVLKIISPRPIIQQNCLHSRLETSLHQTLNTNDEWTNYFKKPIERILVDTKLVQVGT